MYLNKYNKFINLICNYSILTFDPTLSTKIPGICKAFVPNPLFERVVATAPSFPEMSEAKS